MQTGSVSAEITNAAGSHAFVLSSAAPDRVRDTIDAKAYEPWVGKRIIALWQHDHRQPIGTWENLTTKGGRLIGELKLASTNLAQMIKQLIEDDVPLGASLGFRGVGSPNKAGGTHFSAIELLETSVVSVPAHPHAMRIAKSFGLSLHEQDGATLAVPDLSVECPREI
ncbi:MAG: HK97 family phage prohead protease, partial [Planctomycetaceae bacterium]